MRNLLISVLLFAPLSVRAAENVFVRTEPAWVDRVDVRDEKAPDDVRNGIWGLLDDHQIRVDGGRVTEYHRRVRKVLTSAGVQDSSELSIDFDPSYEALVLHDAEVIRNGQRIGELDTTDIRVIEKEPESAERIYDGQLTAMLFLKDVRPGDLIDYSYSLEGANPLLGGKYADELELTAAYPTKHLRHRLVWPSDRRLQYRVLHGGPLPQRPTVAGLTNAGSRPLGQRPSMENAADAPRIEHHGNEDIYVWQRDDAPVVDDEDQRPTWFDPYDMVQLSEFRSWGEVAQWAESLYQPNAESLAAVREVASRIQSEHASQDERITAAIRFVQDDVRYLGIEMGRNTHEPHQPAATLAQRYGDCKDKAFLLCLLLRELGVEAHPAMVNTKVRHRLDAYLPSPFVFDHVIAAVTANGRTHWIDATISEQGGGLATIETPNDERALVIAPQTAELARIATRQKGSIVIEQTYDVPDELKPATMGVVATYRGRDADELRTRLATASIADLGREHLNRYAADQPKIESLVAPKIKDDRDANVIVVRERYRIRDLFTNGSFSYSPRSLELFLKRPETMIRTAPLAFDYPLDVTQRVTFHIARGVASGHAHDERDSPAFHYEREVEADGKQIVITYRLRARKDAVEVAEVPKHLTALNDVTEHISWSVEPRATFASAANWNWSWGFGAIVALVGIFTWSIGRITGRPARNPVNVDRAASSAAATRRPAQPPAVR